MVKKYPSRPWMVAKSCITLDGCWNPINHGMFTIYQLVIRISLPPCSMFDGCHHCHRWFATWHPRQRSSSEFPPSSVRSPRRALQPTAAAALQPQRESSRWKGQQLFFSGKHTKQGWKLKSQSILYYITQTLGFDGICRCNREEYSTKKIYSTYFFT